MKPAKGKKVDFRLMVITGGKSVKETVRIVNECSLSGVKMVQLREKNLTARELLELANKIKVLSLKSRMKFIINDRLDIALLSRANGLHLPEKSVPKKYLSKYLSKYKKLLLGKSVHSLTQAKQAEKDGYDYLLFGPVFRTPAKIKYGAPQGLEMLKSVCCSVSIPIFAVGGITPERVKKCLAAGAHGAAVIRAVMDSPNIRKTIGEFKNGLGDL